MDVVVDNLFSGWLVLTGDERQIFWRGGVLGGAIDIVLVENKGVGVQACRCNLRR